MHLCAEVVSTRQTSLTGCLKDRLPTDGKHINSYIFQGGGVVFYLFAINVTAYNS